MFLFLLLAFLVAGACLLLSWAQSAYGSADHESNGESCGQSTARSRSNWSALQSRVLAWAWETGFRSMVPIGDQPPHGAANQPRLIGLQDRNARMMRRIGLTSWFTELRKAVASSIVIQLMRVSCGGQTSAMALGVVR